jgi:transposase-like protein
MNWIDEVAAAEQLEHERWGDIPCCIYCDSSNVYKLNSADKVGRNPRLLWKCRKCHRQYTVRIGTILNDTRAPLAVWLVAIEGVRSGNKITPRRFAALTGICEKSAYRLLKTVRAVNGQWLSVPAKA